MAKRRRQVAFSFDFSPAIEMVDGLAKMTDREIETAMGKAYDRAMKIPLQTMQEWFEYVHHRSGRTIGAWHDGETKRVGDIILYQYGYDKRKGGLNAIFFEYGTPRIRPEFVMYYSMKNHYDLAMDIIEETLWAEVGKVLKNKNGQRTLESYL